MSDEKAAGLFLPLIRLPPSKSASVWECLGWCEGRVGWGWGIKVCSSVGLCVCLCSLVGVFGCVRADRQMELWHRHSGKQQRVFDDGERRRFLYSAAHPRSKSARSTTAAAHTHTHVRTCAHLSAAVLAFRAPVILACLYSSQQG